MSTEVLIGRLMTEVDQVRASVHDLGKTVAEVDKSNAVIQVRSEEASEGIARIEIMLAESSRAQAAVPPQQGGLASLVTAMQTNPRAAFVVAGTILSLFTATLEGRSRVSDTLDILATQQERVGQIADALGIPENKSLNYEITDPIGEPDGNEEEN